ncbi:fungal-specific transcription factor domain protein [Truncatella angustata]|uniref:Fungal-specific transcription factor domain protein n=1 Tax=Truncatella angustata TaxID=152316 RepID=A0A9P8ZVK8_9PEZI|nr:fungal-specific transcription factor domain protein [Truncatella angustata]KAH6652710.1 fungal-specific transcription factor domain protein [Truncatella angustata]
MDISKEVFWLNGEPVKQPGAELACHPADEERGHSYPAISADKGSSSSVYLTKCGATYVTSAHWAAVLNEIAELKGHFEEAEQREIHSHPPFEEPPSPGQAGPQLLYGCSRLLTKEEILASIPARPVVDKLVSCYFNSFEMSPVIWLGLLFTLMCLATQFQSYRLKPAVDTPETSSPEKDLQQTAETFRQKIVQCLVLGNYTKGGPYVLQTLMLYVAAELFLSNDAEMGVWILLGTIVQLAMQMGYHRDPKHFKGRSPFASEMHRRVWATIVELDLGISAQMGLPRLIRPWQADTMEPSNLQDHDFDKYTVELPPSRPETDLTPMLFRLVRGRMLTAIGAIWDFATDTRPYTYEAVIEMDARLQDAHACIPNCLKWRSIALCIADTPQTVMQKVSLEIIVHRASIVLHRRYLHCLPTDSKEIHSRQKCLDAALKLLEYQQILQDKTEFLGQLYHERWRVSSLVKHDFLLATSILCSYLQQVKKDIHNGIGNEPVNTIREALRKSHAIWLRSSDSSKEAQKAAEAVSIVLGIEGTSASPSEVNTPCTTTNKTSLFSYPNTDDHFPDNCGVQFPAFHTTAWASWQDQSNFELMVPFSVPVSDAGISPQMMDGTYT